MLAFGANSALYAKPANALSSKVFSEVVDLASGDVVQLVGTLPCHTVSIISLFASITYTEPILVHCHQVHRHTFS